MTTPTLSTRLVMTHEGYGPIPVDLSWHDLVPCQIRLMVGGTGGIEWFCARSLLANGLLAEAGVGDVVVRPVGDQLVIVLRTNKSTATLTAHRSDVETFLEQTEAVDPDDDLDEPGWQWLMTDLLVLLREA